MRTGRLETHVEIRKGPDINDYHSEDNNTSLLKFVLVQEAGQYSLQNQSHFSASVEN